MAVNLVIAEKPSVAQSIAKVLGCTVRRDGYLEGGKGAGDGIPGSFPKGEFLVSWCVGHLVELAQPQEYDEKYGRWRKEDLPIFPREWKYEVTEATKKQFQVLKELMKRDDITQVINACDAGREGELIFRLVYEKAGCKKKMKRLWISSMEDEAILKGFASLADGEAYDKLYQAALCRERADWIVGINATRLFSTTYGQTLSVGRVMTPTLALAVEREARIRAFRPEDVFTAELQTECGTLSSGKHKDRMETEEILKGCLADGSLIVTKAEQKERQEKAPALFDLTSLQREANRKLGYTAQQTLDYTQSLYEKKLVSYPRTDSKYLTEDMEEGLPDLIQKAEQVTNLKATENRCFKSVINGKKVTDHHAIILTASVLKGNLEELPRGEREVLKMIAARLLEAVSSPCIYAEAVLEARRSEETFSSKGKNVIDPGWKAITPDTEKSEDNKECRINIPNGLKEGDGLEILSGEVKAGKTTPPKSFTDVIHFESRQWKYSKCKGAG